MSRKCQSKNPSTCKVHGAGGQVAQLEAESLEAIQQGRTEDYFKIREEIDGLKDEISPDQKQSLFRKLFGGSKEPQAKVEEDPYAHFPASARPGYVEPVVENTSSQSAVETVPCGKCSVCDPAPSDATHFGGWNRGQQCENPVPKS